MPESSKQSPGQPGLTVIVPCYNEEQAIADTVRALVDSLAAKNDFEILVVNDGSTDGTRAVLDSLEPEIAVLRVVHLETNCGYGAALKSGIARSSSELIAITDADGTYPNDQMRALVDELGDAAMVVGARIGKDVTYSKIRMIPKAFLRRYASWIARQNIPDMNSGMRVFRRSAMIRFIRILPDSFSFTTTITLALLSSYQPVKYVPISYKARIGKTKIKPIRDTLRFFQLIVRTGMYFAPMRVLTPLIIVLSLLCGWSLSYDILVLRNLTDKSVLLLLFTLNTGMFALLADMIDKRTHGV